MERHPHSPSKGTEQLAGHKTDRPPFDSSPHTASLAFRDDDTNNVLRNSPDEAQTPHNAITCCGLHLSGFTVWSVSSSGHLVLCQAPQVLAALGWSSAALVHYILIRLFHRILLRLFASSSPASDMAGTWCLVQRASVDSWRRHGAHPGLV